ncbi:uncharacterized protein SOCE26_059340 [Sorangium cellulosum]|uniref:Secreted protein n=1 Tax=Sorangium cellulosum TaxID=56 RepID=A0A2L0EYW5_SORCE|nr:uncharacterized protein SOCE26_059340 [Sorangium cellulosum]
MLTLVRGHLGSALLLVVLGSAMAVDQVMSPPPVESAAPTASPTCQGSAPCSRCDPTTPAGEVECSFQRQASAHATRSIAPWTPSCFAQCAQQ